MSIISRYHPSYRCFGVAPLFLLAWIFSATAGSVTATKSCRASSASSGCWTSGRFTLPSMQAVTWNASYSSTPSASCGVAVSTANETSYDTGLGSYPTQSGLVNLAAGTYWISVGSDSMCLGSFTVTGTSLTGEPHIRTINGANYDFQGAGEFVVLRHPGGFELQARMAPIATAAPIVDPHSGLTTCVSVNSAVAARVGKHRVTYQPNITGKPDPQGLQLRVDGELKVLGSRSENLSDGGRLTKTATPGGLMIEFPDQSSVTVTPNWWADQSRWFLDIRMFAPAGSRGIAGEIPSGDWLPLLSNGSSSGPKPASLLDRYISLYRTFADSWRVTDKDTLFDYAPGTSTKTYTLQNWPPEQPPCELLFTVPVVGASKEVAEQTCQRVLAPTDRNNCVFDVMATGHTGFAASYAVSQPPQSKRSKTKARKGYARR